MEKNRHISILPSLDGCEFRIEQLTILHPNAEEHLERLGVAHNTDTQAFVHAEEKPPEFPESFRGRHRMHVACVR